MSGKRKKQIKYLRILQKTTTFALAFGIQSKYGDSLAQLVEHNTFNVGVMGSSPMRVTKKRIQLRLYPLFLFKCLVLSYKNRILAI